MKVLNKTYFALSEIALCMFVTYMAASGTTGHWRLSLRDAQWFGSIGIMGGISIAAVMLIIGAVFPNLRQSISWGVVTCLNIVFACGVAVFFSLLATV